jgi:hypothetical protein
MNPVAPVSATLIGFSFADALSRRGSAHYSIKRLLDNISEYTSRQATA